MSTVNVRPSAASSINPFARSITVESPDETDTADAQHPKQKSSNITDVDTVQLRDNPVLHGLTDFVANLEEETYNNVATAAAKLNSELGLLEPRLNDLCNITNTRITTK